MKYSRATFAALATATLVLVGCSAEPSDSAQSGDDTEQSETRAEPRDDSAAPGDVRGIVDVDGTRYEITELRNCEPLEDGVVDRHLELQGIGEHDGERVQLDVYIEEIGDLPYDDVAWAGPEGVFGAGEHEGPYEAEVTIDDAGASVRGVATLVDAWDPSETILVDFELEIPAETIACR